MTTRDTSALIDLLGNTRSRIVERLRGGAASVAELARNLGLSEVAIRRHLQLLERDGLIEAETVRRDGPGRPGNEYRLTARARRLFPDGSADLANELLDYLQAEYGRSALLGFLKWRTAKHHTRYAGALAASGADDTSSKAVGLAALLSEDGFAAHAGPVTAPDGATVLELQQAHCAIRDIAEEHPEVCAYEAALFQKLLGAPVSRRQTIAGGADACVCTVRLPDVPSEVSADPATHRSTHGNQS